MYACLRLYMPRVGSRQASLNKLIWCKILCYLLCSGDKINNFSKTKVYFHKKTTPQLLGHIGIQNMKVGEKTNMGNLPLFVWCMLTLALNWLLILCLCIPPVLRREKNIYFSTGYNVELMFITIFNHLFFQARMI